MKGKICNQVFKTDLRNITCLSCGITDPMPSSPITLEFYTAILRAFIELHTKKGCNKKDLSKTNEENAV